MLRFLSASGNMRHGYPGGYCNVVLWIDKKFEENYNTNKDTICGWIKELGKVNYDKIVLALSREKDIAEATDLLLQQGVNRQQII